MRIAVIKSNHINLEGHNRKWELISFVSSIKKAKMVLAEQSICCVENSDDWIIRNGRAWHLDKKKYLYTYKQSSFSKDSSIYTYLTEKEANIFFDGRFHGYIPQFIIDEFKIEKR